MTDTAEMIHEDALPGDEHSLDPSPEWQPRYPGSARLTGKIALITGADSGIGRAVAALFAREGADIGILYLLEDKDAEDTKAIVEAEGRRAILIKADVGSKKMCERAVEQVIEAFGRLDILVVSAGITGPNSTLESYPSDAWQRVMAINLSNGGHLSLTAGGLNMRTLLGTARLNLDGAGTLFDGGRDGLEPRAGCGCEGGVCVRGLKRKGLGTGDWGLGTGDWGLGIRIGPRPSSQVPSP